MPGSAHETWKGRHVKFLIRDIHLPDSLEVLLELHGGDHLDGEVIDVSGNARGGGAFVVVRCDRLCRPCVLAVESVEPVD